MKQPFVHLHVHSHYSTFDGVGFIEEYVQKAKENNHPAIALTDHGSMAGTFQLQEECIKNNIKPIPGIELYLKSEEYLINKLHQTVLIKNENGFKSLNKIIYNNYKNKKTIYINLNDFLENSEDIIVLSGCIDSIFSNLLKINEEKKAEEIFIKFKEKFKDDFYGEIILNNIDWQKEYNDFIIKLSKKYNVKTVLTFDIHYTNKEDKYLQDVLLAIQTLSKVGEKFIINTTNNYYSNYDDVLEFNKIYNYNYSQQFIDESLSNTLEVAEKINFLYDTSTLKYPKFYLSEEILNQVSDKKELVYKIAQRNLRKKLKENNITEPILIEKYHRRLIYEIDIIDQKQMLDYFLIIYDIVKNYKNLGYDIGPGRGSVAGSLLAYSLDITKIDPIKFNLYFERFINPTRNNPPDIDLDFISGTEDLVINYIKEKYGDEHVLPVGTFLKLNKKSAIKDVLRAIKGKEETKANALVHKLSNYIEQHDKKDENLTQTIEKIYKDNKTPKNIKEFIDSNKDVIDVANKMVGKIKSIGKHAGGIIITPQPIYELIPTNYISKSDEIISAFTESDLSSKTLSKLGILKIDILKLDTLKIIHECVELIKKYENKDIKPILDNLRLNDPNIYKEIDNHMVGIFQFESQPIVQLLKNMKANSFYDLVATNALYRPGPLKLGADQQYIENKKISKKNFSQKIEQEIYEILSESYGVLLYQEQVMFLAEKLANLPLGIGDMLRRSLEKADYLIQKMLHNEELKEQEKQTKEFQDLIKYVSLLEEGMRNKGYKKEEIEYVKHILFKFSGYSFNKSHCVGYSYLALQTLYLKHYYPLYFYLSLLNNEKKQKSVEEKYEWKNKVLKAAINKKIKILPPSIESEYYNIIIDKNAILLGLKNVKGIGEKNYIQIKQSKEKFEKYVTKENFDFDYNIIFQNI